MPVQEEAAMRILLVEDNLELAGQIAMALNDLGFTLEQAHDGDTGLAFGLSEDFDAVVLDLGLPDIQGGEILKRWRKAGRAMPVLILTARGSWMDKVDGLNAGADDFVVKPAHAQEIAARLRALIRRSAGKSTPILVHGEIELCPASGTVTVSGNPVELTGQEFRILNYFMHRPGRILSQSELLDHIYQLESERGPNTIEVYVSRLRRKLGRDAIKTMRGLGYRFG